MGLFGREWYEARSRLERRKSEANAWFGVHTDITDTTDFLTDEGEQLNVHLLSFVFYKDYFTTTFFTLPFMYLMMFTPFCKVSIGIPSSV